MCAAYSRLMVIGIVCVVPVLICLIGAGILLYIIADSSSAEVAQLAQRQHTAAQWQEKIQSLRQRIAQMEKELQEVDRRLAEAQKAQALQQQIAQLQQEKQRLQQELERLQKQWEAMKNQLSSKSQEVAKLEQEVATAQANLTRLQQKIKEMQPGPGEPSDPGPTIAEYENEKQKLTAQIDQQNNLNAQRQARLDELAQIVKDPGRTFRVEEVRGSQEWQLPPHPLYVECDAEGIILQPENRRLPAYPHTSHQEDFLRTARERKYVLFLIRPNGFDSFQAYRKLLQQKAEGIDYGYEPIRQDGEVIYPKRS